MKKIFIFVTVITLSAIAPTFAADQQCPVPTSSTSPKPDHLTISSFTDLGESPDTHTPPTQPQSAWLQLYNQARGAAGSGLNWLGQKAAQGTLWALDTVQIRSMANQVFTAAKSSRVYPEFKLEVKTGTKTPDEVVEEFLTTYNREIPILVKQNMAPANETELQRLSGQVKTKFIDWLKEDLKK